MSAPYPKNEAERQATLESYDILDTMPEQAYDDLTALAAFICQTPIAVISLIDRDRQWFKSRQGLDGFSTPRTQAFCAHAILDTSQPMVVSDATRDQRFVSNALVTGDPHIRFYAGMPLVAPGGSALGTLCVIDRQARELSSEQLSALTVLSRQVMAQLELRRTTAQLEARLLEQEQYVKHLEQYQLQIEEAQARLETESLTDGLTHVANRVAFDRRLADEILHADRYGAPSSLLMIDVDYFKTHNDRFGHPAGDQVLTAVARLLTQSARATDFVARYGGEEFGVLLPHTAQGGALILAERFRRAVERASWAHGPVTVSVGAATYAPGSGQTLPQVVASADRALYVAKERGRNRTQHVGDLPPEP